MDGLNSTYHHPHQPEMSCEVILASKGENGQKPIYTIRMRYPRPIHGEIMTHRVFSRNARSSRAVPVKTMLDEVQRIPYVPWHWLKNKPGMQGTEPLSIEEQQEAEFLWLTARDYAVNITNQLFDPDGLNIHKQNPNRLLEPFSWIDTLITATDWDNFLWLRQHGAAEPHLQDLANLVAHAIETAHVFTLYDGQWHQPYITQQDIEWAMTEAINGPESMNTLLNKVSAARCARISYKPFDGDASYEKEISRYNHLVSDERVHASPLEHQAMPDTKARYETRRVDLINSGSITEDLFTNPHLHGNLEGYIQARKLVPNEVYSSI